MLKDTQEAFDTIVTHLRQQGERAVTEDDGGNRVCRYHHGGLKCGVGCLIPLDLYLPEFENKGVDRLLHDYSSIEQLFQNVPPAFLINMQEIHDLTDPNSWEYAFKGIAKKYHLSLL